MWICIAHRREEPLMHCHTYIGDDVQSTSQLIQPGISEHCDTTDTG